VLRHVGEEGGGMRPNRTKQKLLAGELIVGTHLSLSSPALAEMCGYLGFDFIIIDMEHLLFDPERFEGIVRAADVTGMTPIFRPSKNDPDLLLPYLDAGAQGVFVPHVATAEDARRVVDAVKYPPDGSRGAGSERAAQYGITTTPAEHVLASNAETLVTVSIEDPEGIQNVDEIAAVKGLDVVCMGPGDLALALGHPGDYDHPDVQEVFRHLITRIRENGKVAGITTWSVESAARYYELGIRYTWTSVKKLLGEAGSRYISGVRGLGAL
jgi:4-hydroxy-2-oxoheptanedioate aldolase